MKIFKNWYFCEFNNHFNFCVYNNFIFYILKGYFVETYFFIISKNFKFMDGFIIETISIIRKKKENKKKKNFNLFFCHRIKYKYKN